MGKHPETMPQTDVVDLLVGQHRQIRRLFAEVEGCTGRDRADAFDRLRRLLAVHELAVHETAEEEIVHPISRRAIDGGDTIVDARLSEEHHVKQLLENLDRISPDDPAFPGALRELKKAALDHADREENEEFPRLRAHADAAQLRGMALAVKAADAVAPTFPHAGVESARHNILAGPFAAMRDRTRDFLRAAMHRGG